MCRLEALHNVEKKYYEEGIRIIETLKNAYILYKQQPPVEQRKLLNYLLSNCKLEGRKVSYDYNLSFSYFINFGSCRKKYARIYCLGFAPCSQSFAYGAKLLPAQFVRYSD